jgi:hypothetical protein
VRVFLLKLLPYDRSVFSTEIIEKLDNQCPRRREILGEMRGVDVRETGSKQLRHAFCAITGRDKRSADILIHACRRSEAPRGRRNRCLRPRIPLDTGRERRNKASAEHPHGRRERDKERQHGGKPDHF